MEPGGDSNPDSSLKRMRSTGEAKTQTDQG